MKKNFLVLTLILLAANLFAQEQLEIRKKIIPLRSNRSDVEKIAKFVKNFSNFVRYETDNEFLNIHYSKTECIGHGWNVPIDRVISYESYPKQKLSLEEVNKYDKKLFKIVDDAFTSYFINSANGIEFVVPTGGEQKVEYIGFSPSMTDSSLRCQGFPEFDLISEHYSPYQTVIVNNASSWDVGQIYDPLHQIKENPDYQGYIFVYCKRKQTNKCEKLKRKVEGFSKYILKNEKINQIIVESGGYRNRIEIETILIPKDYPSAKPRPTLPAK